MLGFLILFPLLVALLLLIIRNSAARKVIVYAGGIIIAAASIALVCMHLGTKGEYFTFSSDVVNYACTAVDLLIALCVLVYGIKYKNWLAIVLTVVQGILAGVFAFGGFETAVPTVTKGLYVDSLSLLMTFIIGVIGSGICIYALGYMEDHHRIHPDVKDRQPLFFGIMFAFLSGMYIIVFSNNMAWLFTGWEITTLCSFLLIGYDQSEIAIKNSFRQIIMNMLGGITFACALFYCSIALGTLSFYDFLLIGQYSAAMVMVPVVCLSFSGLTKAAQMPFHTWLLGAMVAPTPTSALLHSSTMVKAGVFLLVKMAPIYYLSTVGSMMIILIGGITFCLCAFMAISQSNAKRVLAYSTISNLGLIVACAGVGTPEAVWAAEFLILFHAIAKSLLFLCVGTAEHHIGSRDIESMDDLFERMPRLARYMMLGIMVMFIAPFGMLLAKWATLVSFLETTPPQIALIILLAFGSAATFMFWAKWLGKLTGIAGNPDNIETTVHTSEWLSTGLMVVLAVAGCILMPLISDYLVKPYLAGVYGKYSAALSSDNLWICSACVIFITVVLFAGLKRGTKKKQVGIYLSGISVDNDKREFRNSMSGATIATARNWYLESIFGEKVIDPIGTVCSIVIIVIAFGFACIGVPGIY